MFMPPPERFSTTIGWPSRFCSSSPSARTKMSLVPPALLAVMTRMGLLGQDCALAAEGRAQANAASVADNRVSVFIGQPSSVELEQPPRVVPENLFLVGGGNLQI